MIKTSWAHSNQVPQLTTTTAAVKNRWALLEYLIHATGFSSFFKTCVFAGGVSLTLAPFFFSFYFVCVLFECNFLRSVCVCVGIKSRYRPMMIARFFSSSLLNSHSSSSTRPTAINGCYFRLKRQNGWMESLMRRASRITILVITVFLNERRRLREREWINNFAL